MDRGSTKHGFRLDEQLEHEVEGSMRGGHSTHAQEWKDPEPSGEDQPDVDLVPGGTLTGGVPEGLTAAEVEERSRLATYLGRTFPATGRELVDRATEASAPDVVLSRLTSLDGSRTFSNLQDVWSALGGGGEEHRF